MSPEDKIGEEFQQQTKYDRDKMGGGGLDWANRPETYKEYKDCESVISLPPPRAEEGPGIWRAISRRRSVRDYAPEAISLAELSQLLWASQGITAAVQGYELRAAPSAGALYPVETYIVANNVSGLESGVYHYRVRTAQLELLRRGDFGVELAAAALGQEMCAEAGAVFVWTAVVQRCKWKYRQRAYRYIYLDAGHVAAHVSIAAAAMGLGTCQIGALFDDEVNRIIGVDGREETVLYMSTVGRPATGAVR